MTHGRALNESTNVGTKTGRSRVGDPNYGSKSRWVTGNVETAIYPGSGPLEEVKPYVLLDCIDDCMKVTELIYLKIGWSKP
jgi:hypothetical protein